MNYKSIRWQQRFNNLKKAFAQLKEGLAIKSPSNIEKQGIIQSFEFTFELCWKVMKDFLESEGVDAVFPREVIKQAFAYEYLNNGKIWLEMLENRNIIAHSYDEKIAEEIYGKIKNVYFGAIKEIYENFDARLKEKL